MPRYTIILKPRTTANELKLIQRMVEDGGEFSQKSEIELEAHITQNVARSISSLACVKEIKQ